MRLSLRVSTHHFWWLAPGGHQEEQMMSHDKIRAAARERMARTGESYQTARFEVIRARKATRRNYSTPKIEDLRLVTNPMHQMIVQVAELAKARQSMVNQVAETLALANPMHQMIVQVAELAKARQSMVNQVAETLALANPMHQMAAQVAELAKARQSIAEVAELKSVVRPRALGHSQGDA